MRRFWAGFALILTTLALGVPAAQAAPTGGSGGTFTNQLDRSFSWGGMTSTYHVLAAGVDPTKEVGALIWLDGTAGYGFDNENNTYLLDVDGANGMRDVAQDNNMILITATAPPPNCDGGDNCWFNESTSPNATQKADWMKALIDRVYSQYNVETDRVFIGGYSSGAQGTARWLIPRHGAAIQTDGVNVFVAYGGAPANSAGTPTFTADYKSKVHFHWNTGTADSAYSTQSWGARGGYNWYTNNGFQTSATWPQGVGHSRGGEFDDIARAQIAKHVRAAAPVGGTTPPPTGGETTLSSQRITGYWDGDNDPPGSNAIAYEDVRPDRQGTSGTGTYADPLTVAVPTGKAAPGTIVYFPHEQVYGIVEDECATSHSAPDGCTADFDIWVGDMSLTAAEADACMSRVTGSHSVIVNAASGKTVRSTPICGDGGATPPPTGTPAIAASATPGDTTATITWSATGVADPSVTGVWVWRVGTASDVGTYYAAESGSHTYTGLTNGTEYDLRVTLVHDDGRELAFGSAKATPTGSTTPPPTGGQTLLATGDTMVRGDSPGTTYGDNSTMRVDDGAPKISYVEFGQAPASTTQATLRIYSPAGYGTAPFAVHTVSAGGLSESTTYNTRPALGPQVGTGAPVSGGWAEVTVTVPAGQLPAFALVRTGSGSDTVFSTRETVNDPELVYPV